MKKKSVLMLIILSILALTLTAAAKAPHITKVSLESMSFMKEKGVTFKFLVEGDFKKSDLKGKVMVDGNTIKLYCNYSGDAAPVVVTCTAFKGTAAKYAGKLGVVTLVGHSFSFTVPARQK